MAYLTRLAHIRFEKKGDTLHIKSERDDSFKLERDWPEEWSATDEDLQSKLHERFYVEAEEAHP
jgi:uncharacterized lipoprotein